MVTSLKNELESVLKDSTSQIRNEVKAGIKEGIKEALAETLDQIQDDTANQANNDLLKQLALFSSSLFLFYFLFILPGSSINPEEFTQYNWFNHSLIDLKFNIINLFTNPSTPRNPGTGAGGTTSLPLSPLISETSKLSSVGIPTVTQNSPINSTNKL